MNLEQTLTAIKKFNASKKITKREAKWKCMECGRKFYSTAFAEYAIFNGCPKCNGVDIDLA